MTRRTATRFAGPTPFDEASYATIVGMIDAAEDWLVESGKCRENEAHAWLTRDYLKCAAGIINGATCYVTIDEKLAASIFLSSLPGAKLALRSTRRADACAKMLFEQRHMFFPDYGTLLRYFFDLEMKRTFPTSLRMNGLILLAAATLPGARAQIRRENRRRDGFEGLLVTNDDMKRRMIPASDLDSRLFFANQSPNDMIE